MYIVSRCPKHQKVLEYWKETQTHTLFKCPDCDYTGNGVVHRDLPERYIKQAKRIKELEERIVTQVICHIESCSCRTAGICKATTIHLHGCSPDADNVVACSEFKEK